MENDQEVGEKDKARPDHTMYHASLTFGRPSGIFGRRVMRLN
jgi:hypothetical protein